AGAALPGAGTPPGLPFAGRPPGASPDHRVLRAAHGGAAHHELDPLLRLAGHRARHLPAVQPPAQRVRSPEARRPGRARVGGASGVSGRTDACRHLYGTLVATWELAWRPSASES